MTKVVVMIDDDASSLNLIRDVVEYKLDGYTLIPIFGDVSRDILGQIPSKVDAFFVDYDMIGIEGPEIIAKLVRRFPKARIVGWTAEMTAKKKSAFIKAGATEVIKKPFGVDAYIKVIM